MAAETVAKVSSTDVTKRFGFDDDAAMTYPLAIEQAGEVRFRPVLLTPGSWTSTQDFPATVPDLPTLQIMP